jgi:hypothetical protein
MFTFLIRKVATDRANQAEIASFRSALRDEENQQRFILLANQVAAEYERSATASGQQNREAVREASRAARRLRQELSVFDHLGTRNVRLGRR